MVYNNIICMVYGIWTGEGPCCMTWTPGPPEPSFPVLPFIPNMLKQE